MRATGQAHFRSTMYLANTVSGRRSRRFRKSNVPVAELTPLAASQAVLDELVKVYFSVGREPLASVDIGQLHADLDAIIDHNAITGCPHAEPAAPGDYSIERRRFGGIRGEWLRFESGWAPHDNAPGRDPWIDDDINNIAQVGLLRHPDHEARPWLVLVHGAEMGRHRLDARIMRAEYFHNELGVNVAMPVLPRHGPRGPGTGHVRGEFPSDDFVSNIHGLTQAVWDVRQLLAWIRDQGGDTIGIYGFSLGGNVTAQIAQHEPDVDALIAGCPAVSMVDLVRSNMPPAIRRRHRELFDKAAVASEVISPLSSAAVTPHENLVVLGAAHDRLADPLNQAARLWKHWDEPEFHVLPRGHVSFMFGQTATRTIEAALRQRGVSHHR